MLLHTYWLTHSLTHTHTLAIPSTSTRAATALREHSSALQHASVRNTNSNPVWQFGQNLVPPEYAWMTYESKKVSEHLTKEGSVF